MELVPLSGDNTQDQNATTTENSGDTNWREWGSNFILKAGDKAPSIIRAFRNDGGSTSTGTQRPVYASPQQSGQQIPWNTIITVGAAGLAVYGIVKIVK